MKLLNIVIALSFGLALHSCKSDDNDSDISTTNFKQLKSIVTTIPTLSAEDYITSKKEATNSEPSDFQSTSEYFYNDNDLLEKISFSSGGNVIDNTYTYEGNILKTSIITFALPDITNRNDIKTTIHKLKSTHYYDSKNRETKRVITQEGKSDVVPKIYQWKYEGNKIIFIYDNHNISFKTIVTKENGKISKCAYYKKVTSDIQHLNDADFVFQYKILFTNKTNKSGQSITEIRYGSPVYEPFRFNNTENLPLTLEKDPNKAPDIEKDKDILSRPPSKIVYYSTLILKSNPNPKAVIPYSDAYINFFNNDRTSNNLNSFLEKEYSNKTVTKIEDYRNIFINPVNGGLENKRHKASTTTIEHTPDSDNYTLVETKEKAIYDPKTGDLFTSTNVYKRTYTWE